MKTINLLPAEYVATIRLKFYIRLVFLNGLIFIIYFLLLSNVFKILMTDKNQNLYNVDAKINDNKFDLSDEIFEKLSILEDEKANLMFWENQFVSNNLDILECINEIKPNSKELYFTKVSFSDTKNIFYMEGFCYDYSTLTEFISKTELNKNFRKVNILELYHLEKNNFILEIERVAE